MESPVYIALSRQAGLAKELSIVANNVANASTTGYRVEHTLFQEYLTRTGPAGQRENMSLTQDVGLVRDVRAGELQQTGNDGDLAVRGSGYLVVGTPGQELYTRTGTFTVDNNRQIMTSDGYPLLSTNGPITLPAGQTNFKVTGDGVVTAEDGTQLGTLRVVQFANEQSMRKAGINLYATDQQAQPVAQPQVVQGTVEGSNVKPVLELTRLLDMQRDYGALQKFVDSEVDRQKSTIQRLGRSA